MRNIFEVRDPDFELSPFTGMTKKHYIECAKYVLERAFKHVRSIETPISFPTVPGKTYPQPNAPEWRYRSADFEALERTFTWPFNPRRTLNNHKQHKTARLLQFAFLQCIYARSCQFIAIARRTA